MRLPARYSAAIDILDEVFLGKRVGAVLAGWQRRNRYAGAKDRAAIRDIVYGVLRRRQSLQYIGGVGALGSRGAVIGAVLAEGLALDDVFGQEGYAPPALNAEEVAGLRDINTVAEAAAWVRLDCPRWLWDIVQADLGAACEGVFACLQSRAPVDLRVNSANISREDVAAALAEDGFATSPLADLPNGLRLSGEVRKLEQTAVFMDGGFELQDAHSQAVVRDMIAGAGLGESPRILDYCAGAGGKALAMADALSGKMSGAQISVYDKAVERLRLLKVRAKRAGVKFQYMLDEPHGAAFDLVLADAPCSGSGSWRRDPDGKWKLTAARLEDLCAEQAWILARAAGLVEAGGVLAYCTCSVLACENAAQVAAFLEGNAGWECLSQQTYLPSEGDDKSSGGDGFFLALFRKKT